MMLRVFISYNFKDRQLAHGIRQLFDLPDGESIGTPVFVSKDVSMDGETAIDHEIRTTMETCQCALFVIGNNVHNSPWINREAQLAISRGLGLVAVRLPGTTGALPHVLAPLKLPLAGWSPDDVRFALDQSRLRRH